MKGGFWDAEFPRPASAAGRGNYLGVGPNVNYTGFHYDTTVSETRIASYIAIARRQVPASALLRHLADLPGRLSTGYWQEQQPTGETRTYLGDPGLRGRLRATAACASCRAGAARCSRR